MVQDLSETLEEHIIVEDNVVQLSAELVEKWLKPLAKRRYPQRRRITHKLLTVVFNDVLREALEELEHVDNSGNTG